MATSRVQRILECALPSTLPSAAFMAFSMVFLAFGSDKADSAYVATLDRARSSPSMEVRELGRSNAGIFYDCFGATVADGSPLDEAISTGARVCWQNLCNQPAGDTSAPRSRGQKRRQIPASRYPSKLEKIFLRPLEAGDWGDFQLCLLANLGVFDTVSVGLSAESLKALVYATNASVGNHTILGEFVDFCLEDAAKLQVADQTSELSGKSVRASSKEQSNLKSMYDKFTTCLRKQIQIACYLPENIMFTEELSDRSEYLYSLLPRPKRSSLTQLSAETDEHGALESPRVKRDDFGGRRERTIIVKRRFLNRAPQTYHGYPDLMPTAEDDSGAGTAQMDQSSDGFPVFGGSGPKHEAPPRPLGPSSHNRPNVRPPVFNDGGDQPPIRSDGGSGHFPGDLGAGSDGGSHFPEEVARPPVLPGSNSRRPHIPPFRPTAASQTQIQSQPTSTSSAPPAVTTTRRPDPSVESSDSERPFLLIPTPRPTYVSPTDSRPYVPADNGNPISGNDIGTGNDGNSIGTDGGIIPERPRPKPRPTTAPPAAPYVPPWNPRTIRVDLCNLKVENS